MKTESLSKMLAHLCFLLQAEQDRKSTRAEVRLNIHSSAELTALPAGIRDTGGEALSKLQCEHISTDTQSLYKTVSPQGHI